MSQFEAKRSLKPFGPVGLDAIDHLDFADNAAARQIVGNGDLKLFLKFGFALSKVGRQRLCGMDQERAAKIGFPYPILNVLMPVDNQPSKRLFNGQNLHALFPFLFGWSARGTATVLKFLQFFFCEHQTVPDFLRAEMAFSEVMLDGIHAQGEKPRRFSGAQ